MEIFRFIIKYKLQMSSTYDDDLVNKLQRNVYINYPEEVHKLKEIIKYIFISVNERFRICLWGCFNTNIEYKTWLESTTKEKIIINHQIHIVNMPKYCGTPSIDNILRKWVLLHESYKLHHFPFNSKNIIKAYAHSLHLFSIFSFYFCCLPQTFLNYNCRIYVLYN